MHKQRNVPNALRTTLVCLMATLLAAITSTTGLAADTPTNQKTGILWKVPTGIRPNMQLFHPRVTYTAAGVQQARAKLVGNVQWAKSVYDNIMNRANSFSSTDEQIRNLVPRQYSYYKYLDTYAPCPDGSPMTASWANPGKVSCGGKLYPDAAHPDNGAGWRDEKGVTHYFVARWNGFVVKYLTDNLPSLAMAYALSGEEKYAHKVAVILDALATIYPTATEGPLDYPGLRPGLEGGRLERPYYQTARVLLHYTNATDLIWNSKELDAPSVTNSSLSVRDNITYNLLLNGADYCYREAMKNTGALTNGVADYNKAVLAVGSMLGIETYVEWAVNGPTSFRTMVANNIDRDGLYFESTSGYTDYVRTIYLQVADLMYNLRTPKYPNGLNYYNDPRFAALYVDSRERLFVAGRDPSYGDSDPDRTVGVGKPIDETAAKQIIQFAIRADDAQARARYWDIVAEGTNGVALTSAQDEWGLFNVNEVPAKAVIAKRVMPNAEVLGGKGMSLLRSGVDRGAFLRYGTTLYHGHGDELGLLLYTNGRELSYDPGYYDAHYRVGWTHQTVSHLTTVVNQTKQQGAGGSLNFSTSAQGFSATEALDAGAYAHQGVSVYRRMIALIDSTPDQSYMVDIFRVKGGHTRDYSFHSWSNKFSTTGVQLSDPQPGSVASTTYSWHDKIGVDGKVIPYRSMDFSWQAPGNGYGFLGNPRTVTAEKPWSATWEYTDRKLRLFMLPAKDRELIVADGPSPMEATKYLLAREKGNGSSQFVSVIDMTTRQFQVAETNELPVTVAKPGDFATVAFAVQLANQPQVTDVFLSSLTGSFRAQAADGTYETDAELASVRKKGAAVESLHLTKGTYLNAGSMRLTGIPTEYSGSIMSVDYLGNSILVSGSIPDTVVGLDVLVSAPEYSHNSPYRVTKVEREGSLTRLHLAGVFDLALGHMPQDPFGKRLQNTAPLSYTKVISRSSASDYYNGKLVVNDRDNKAQIERVDSDSSIVVDNASGFAKNDRLTIYDTKAGDVISIPVSVHFTKLDGLTYEFTGPQPAWLSISGKNDLHVYVTNADGEYVQAKSELRDGTRWFEITPGKVVLGQTARFTGPSSLTISDNVQTKIQLKLADLVTRSPITGAAVSAELDGRTLQLLEEAAGTYGFTIPEGVKVGRHDLQIIGHKEGIGIYPYTINLETKADWRIELPQAVKVKLGAPHVIHLTLDRLGSANAKVQAKVADQAVTVEPEDAGSVTLHIPPVGGEQLLQVRVTKTNGFTQEATTILQPDGGRIILLEAPTRLKAGQDLKVKAKFIASDGSVLSGDKIPLSMILFGFFSSDPFSDSDGDGIATAAISSLPRGPITLTLWAEGCENVDFSVTVEP